MPLPAKPFGRENCILRVTQIVGANERLLWADTEAPTPDERYRAVFRLPLAFATVAMIAATLAKVVATPGYLTPNNIMWTALSWALLWFALAYMNDRRTKPIYGLTDQRLIFVSGKDGKDTFSISNAELVSASSDSAANDHGTLTLRIRRDKHEYSHKIYAIDSVSQVAATFKQVISA